MCGSPCRRDALSSNCGRCEYDNRLVNIHGFDYTCASMKLHFAVEGMTCQRCAARVRLAALSVSGVSSVEVDLKTASASAIIDGTISVDDQTIATMIASALTSAGYPSTPA